MSSKNSEVNHSIYTKSSSREQSFEDQFRDKEEDFDEVLGSYVYKCIKLTEKIPELGDRYISKPLKQFRENLRKLYKKELDFPLSKERKGGSAGHFGPLEFFFFDGLGNEVILKKVARDFGYDEHFISSNKDDEDDLEDRIRSIYNNRYGKSSISEKQKEAHLLVIRKEFLREEFAELLGEMCQFEDDEILPDDILLDLIKEHYEMFKKRRELLRAEIKNILLPQTVKLIEDAIENGLISLSKKILDERLATLKFAVIDDASVILGEKYGKYGVAAHTIGIPSGIPSGEKNLAVLHEFIHALAGVLFLRDEDSKISLPYKCGVRFGKFNQTFSWLDEAITESLTLQLSKEDKGTYSNERQLMSLLAKECGLDDKIFFDAYFENYDERNHAHSDTGLPMWRKFNKAIADKLGPSFLVKLDRYVMRNGARKTLEDWRAKGTVDFLKLL